MFNKLKKAFQSSPPARSPTPDLAPDAQNLAQSLDGAYRRHPPEDVARFTALACDAFPEYAGLIDCFGADWLGRQFATDRSRLVDGRPQVLLLEPGTGEALEIPVDIDTFHDQELRDQPDAAIALSFYRDWRAQGGARPDYDQCIGYRRPLFLGGTDDVSNLELTDLDVYWTLTAQLLAQTRATSA